MWKGGFGRPFARLEDGVQGALRTLKVLKDFAQSSAEAVDARDETVSEALEYWAVRGLVGLVGALPRPVARVTGAVIGWVCWNVLGGLRKTGLRNLKLAFPEKTDAEREEILRKLYKTLGWQIAEFCKMRGYTLDEASRFVRYEGLDHYLRARDKGRGVLVLTGHLGAWSFRAFITRCVGIRCRW